MGWQGRGGGVSRSGGGQEGEDMRMLTSHVTALTSGVLALCTPEEVAEQPQADSATKEHSRASTRRPQDVWLALHASRYSVSLIYWYKCTNTDAAHEQPHQDARQQHAPLLRHSLSLPPSLARALYLSLAGQSKCESFRGCSSAL